MSSVECESETIKINSKNFSGIKAVRISSAYLCYLLKAHSPVEAYLISRVGRGTLYNGGDIFFKASYTKR